MNYMRYKFEEMVAAGIEFRQVGNKQYEAVYQGKTLMHGVKYWQCIGDTWRLLHGIEIPKRK